MHDNHVTHGFAVSNLRARFTGEASQASEGAAREPRGDESAGVLLNN